MKGGFRRLRVAYKSYRTRIFEKDDGSEVTMEKM